MMKRPCSDFKSILVNICVIDRMILIPNNPFSDIQCNIAGSAFTDSPHSSISNSTAGGGGSLIGSPQLLSPNSSHPSLGGHSPMGMHQHNLSPRMMHHQHHHHHQGQYLYIISLIPRLSHRLSYSTFPYHFMIMK